MASKIAHILENYFTQKEAARQMGITTVTLWRRIKDGKIKAERIGREVLIEKAFVRRYLRKAA